MILKRALGEVQRGWRAGQRGSEHFKVPVAAGDVDGSGAHRLAFDGFATRRWQRPVEALGEEAREELRHVLHDEHRQRKVRGKDGEQDIEGGRTSGGDADGNHRGRCGDELRAEWSAETGSE